MSTATMSSAAATRTEAKAKTDDEAYNEARRALQESMNRRQ